MRPTARMKKGAVQKSGKWNAMNGKQKPGVGGGLGQKRGNTELQQGKPSGAWKNKSQRRDNGRDKESQRKYQKKEDSFEGEREEAEEEYESPVEEVPADEEYERNAQGESANDGTSDDDDQDDHGEDEEAELKKHMKAANRKGKKSGGFQSMGLSSAVFKAIEHKGYKIPTPIQRKAIPVITDGRDVVAMARTGSGKTAAFLIPLLERLKAHSAKVGARALVLSPSRELAFQTLKFCKEFGKYTDLRSCMLVGGDRMEEQFSLMTSNPDIIIATPGRLMHLIIEMNLDLSLVEYVVFDEADRLFELGFAEHLREILFKLPSNRQTLLFSATLPRMLVDFARAGLTEPILIRLDVDTKISKDLQNFFCSVKADEKEASLIHLLNTQIPRDELTIIFAATKHHVEYLHELLLQCGFDNTYIYGSLDQSARKYNLMKFRSGKTKIFIVTDVASRGIDIPLLDNVINYDFPGSSKVFIHRVGRAARAGRSGKAWSLLASDEIPYMLDLQLFTGKSLVFAHTFETTEQNLQPDYIADFVLGQFPASSLSLEVENVISTLKGNTNLEQLKESALNGYRLYLKSRPVASSESHKRAKEMADVHLGIHPTFAEAEDIEERARASMLSSISHFRPPETIFEVGKKGNRTTEALLMLNRRAKLGNTIAATKSEKRERDADRQKSMESLVAMASKRSVNVGDEELESTFASTGKKRKIPVPGKFKDEEFYMKYQPEDAATEKGYSMKGEGSGVSLFEKAQSATLEMTADDAEGLRKKSALKWDSTKHRFQRDTLGSDNKKKIRSESGVLVDASYKSNRFHDWQKRSKIHLPRVGERELPQSKTNMSANGLGAGGRKYRHNSMTAPTPNSKSGLRKANRREKEARSAGGDSSADLSSKRGIRKVAVPSRKGPAGRAAKNELKSVSEIAKARHEKEKRREKTGRHGLSKKKGAGGVTKKRPAPKSKFKPSRRGKK